MKESLLERVLRQDLERVGIPFEQEYYFAKEALGRDWRADFLIKGSPILIEVEGGAGFGRHSRRQGFISDAEKYAAAARLGYIVLRFTKPQIEGRMAPGMESEAVETTLCAISYFGEEASA